MNERGIQMVVTQVDAQVAPERWQELRDGYRSMTVSLEPQLIRTYLLQEAADPTHWSVVTVWKSRAALDEYIRSVETPGAFVLFRSVDAEPRRTIFNVAECAPPDG